MFELRTTINKGAAILVNTTSHRNCSCVGVIANLSGGRKLWLDAASADDLEAFGLGIAAAARDIREAASPVAPAEQAAAEAEA